MLQQTSMQEIAELAWACATLGFRDVGLMSAIVSRAQRDYASLNQEVVAKIEWASSRLQATPILSPTDESRPEEMVACRERANAVLATFLSYLPEEA